jgi:type IV secretory pathway VirB2 component (pilin)
VSLSCAETVGEVKTNETFSNSGGKYLQKNHRFIIRIALTLALAKPVYAQGNSPWENAVNVLQQSFTGPIAKGLALVAIVIGELTFAFGEGGCKRTFAGIVFGLGMAVPAVNFLTWLFGV